jgi:hypothetical protein
MLGRRGLTTAGLIAIAAGGAIFSGFLVGSLRAFTSGLISPAELIAIQYVNPIWYIALPWLVENYQAVKRVP